MHRGNRSFLAALLLSASFLFVLGADADSADAIDSFEPINVNIGDNPINIGREPHVTHIYKFWRENLNAHSYFLYLVTTGLPNEQEARPSAANIVTFSKGQEMSDGIAENPDAEPCPSFVRFFVSRKDGVKKLYVAQSATEIGENGATGKNTISFYHLVANESPGGPRYEFVEMTTVLVPQEVCDVAQLDAGITQNRALWSAQ